MPIEVDVAPRIDWVRGKAKPEDRILEVGSADNQLWNDSGLNVTLFDLPHDPKARQDNKVPPHVYGTAERLPFEDDSFDVVSICEVLEHLQDPQIALREAIRVASKRVILTVPNEWDWPDSLSPFVHTGHVRFYDDAMFLFLMRSTKHRFEAKRISFGPWAWFGGVIHKVKEDWRPNMDLEQIRYLVWNDQGLKAKEMMDQLKREKPDDPNVLALAAEVDAWVGHLASKEEYERFYSNYRSNFTSLNDVWSAHDRIPRFGVIRQWIAERPPRSILDLGCFDGFALINLAKAFGALGVGVDLDEKALAYATEMAKQAEVSCQFIRSFAEDLRLGRKFDAILITELLEHVIDPAAVIRAAEHHLSEDGRIYITLPASPVPHFGSPREGREHVRCPTGQEMRMAAGDLVVERSMLRRSGQHIERIFSLRRPKIAFFVNQVEGGWSPLRPGGYAGSEEGVVALAGALSERGARVEVYHNAPSGVPDTVTYAEGREWVQYRPREDFNPSSDWDVVVLVKCPEMLDKLYQRPVLFWTTDPNTPADFTPARLAKVQRIVAISEWHRQELIKLNPQIDPRMVVAMPYGVPLGISGFHPPVERPPHKVMYASSFDRGLQVLLTEWPKVRASVPDAELHIWYGWDLFDKFTQGNVAAGQWKAYMVNLMTQDGVVMRQRLESPYDPKPFAEAAIWAYPCTGGERFCITAIKAQRLGAIPVVIPTMALDNTVRFGVKVAQQSAFADALIKALRDEEWQKVERQRMMADPDVALPWERVAGKWIDLIQERLGDLP